MYLVEFLYLLASESKIDQLMKNLPKELESFCGKDELATAHILRNPDMVSTMVVALTWNQTKKIIKPEKTRLGLLLGERLERAGMVNHTVWLSEKSFDL